MRADQTDDRPSVKATIASRHCEAGFTLLELTFTMLLVPLFVALLVHMLAFGGALYEQPRGNVTMTPQLFVRKVIDSRDCAVKDGRLAGVYVRPDETTWAWTLKQINGNLVMVGEEGGNLLFIRGIDRYRVETVGSGYRVRWADATGEREKYVMCMRAASSSSLP
ncbi:hypothetical protein [Exiguobacterium sp. ZOR0005]|uniref:hypothetical protein n=1 Tax=Exiguobacterium sp. ZOR0005 TaxID=1339226 RepID=UPI0006478E5D|nr:hypothetical protein [Exiguobacterium sp. ZOR0005]